MSLSQLWGTEEDPRWTTCQCDGAPAPIALVRVLGVPSYVCGDCFLTRPVPPRKQDWSPRDPVDGKR